MPSIVQSATYTCGGTAANNSECYFPFEVSSNVNFSQCTYYDSARPWCYVANTTTNTQTDKWGYCDCDNITPSPVAAISMNDSIPTWYAYTKGILRDGVLKALVIPIVFDRDNLTNGINITDYYYETAESTELFYSDSTWGKMTFDIEFTNTSFWSGFSPETITTGQMALEAYKFAEEERNLQWCTGICGRVDDYFNNLRIADNNYDQIIILITSQSGMCFCLFNLLCFVSFPFFFFFFFCFTKNVLFLLLVFCCLIVDF